MKVQTVRSSVPTDRTAARSTGAGASTDKILSVLEAVSAPGGPHLLGEVSSRTGLAKSTAHRLVGLLVEHGYVVAAGDGRYGVGPRLRTIAAEVMSGTDEDVHILEDLQRAVGGHTVHLALRSGDHAVYIQKIDGDQPYQMASRVGMSFPLHSTAIGKAILSQLPKPEVDAIVGRTGLPGRTATTITRASALHRELATVGAQGYAIDNEENERAIRCIAVSFSGVGRNVVGGVSVSTLKPLTTLEELRTFRQPLRVAGQAFARTLG
jgi:IclR family acetate operon transcriptional repressor